MMRLLLDTHIFLWYITGDRRLSEDKRESIRNSDNEVYLSVVALWEMIIKYQLDKLQLPQPPEVYLPIQRECLQIFSLNLDEASVSHLAQLPSIHRDPFDGMLVCQANVHDLRIVSVDDIIMQYPVQILS